MAEHTTATSKSGGPSKLDAVGQAMARLGNDAGRTELQAYVKQHFGYDMSPDHVSNCRRIVLQKQGTAGKKTPARSKKAPAKKGTAGPRARKTAANGRAAAHGLSLEDVETTQDLLGRVGVAQLQSLINLLAP